MIQDDRSSALPGAHLARLHVDFVRSFTTDFKEANSMDRLHSFAFGLVVLFPACLLAQQGTPPAAQVPPAPQQPTLSERPSAAPDNAQGRVKLDVVVTDKSGKPVSGLDRAEFTLLDDKQPAKILSFHAHDETAPAAAPPVEVILLVDTVNVGSQYVSFARQEIEKFLRQNGGHLAYPVSILVMTNLGLTVQSAASIDGNALAADLTQLDARLRTIGRSQGAWGDIDRFQFSLKIMGSLVSDESQKPGKKLLIWIGPGWPLLDGPGFSFSLEAQQQNFDAIIALSTRMREAQMVVYSVSQGTGEVHSFAYQAFLKGVKQAKQAAPPNLALKVLATQSGGRVLGPDNDIAAQIDRSVADATVYYTISFDPPRADRANEYHDLKVQIGKPGLTARTITGYYNQP
jgi:VWFA-related protein